MLNVAQGHNFSLSLGSLPWKVRVTGFRLEEGLSSIPRCEVELVSEFPDIPFDKVMDKGAALTIVDRQGDTRVFNGLVSGFAQGDTGHRWTAYRATIEPALHRLQYRSDSRIFQQKSVQDILTQVLNEAGVSQHRFTLVQKRPVREFMVQYRESDYDFFARLCAEEGLVFYHVFENGEAILEINDSLAHPAPIPGLDRSLLYKPSAGGYDPDMPSFIQRFEYEERLRAGNLAQRDYWFKKPAYFWDKQAAVNPAPLQAKQGAAGKDLRLYDGNSRGHHDEGDATARRYANYRLEEHRKDGATGKGRSTVAQLVPGFGFKMEGSQQKGLNQKYLVTRLVHEGKQPQALDADAPEESSDYFNHFEVIPNGIEWRAEHYWHSDAPRKPRVDGPQLARVVGPAGEEIFCDEYGRVKLQFPWDRHGKGDEHSSCWVRVSQLWAGTKYGGMAIPRIGQEVIVEFLDGDIDQPIITGRTYNATNQVPYDLPVNKTRTTWKSDTHKGKGFNELRFEDEAGKEEVYLHAETDFNLKTLQDKNELVGNNSSSLTLGRHINHSIGRNEIQSTTSVVIRALGKSPLLSMIGSKFFGKLKAKLGIAVDRNLYRGISILSGHDINSQAVGSIKSSASKNWSASARKNLNLRASNGMSLGADRTLSLSANNEVHISSKGYQISSSNLGIMIESEGSVIKVDASGHVVINANNVGISAASKVKIEAGEEISLKSPKIKLN